MDHLIPLRRADQELIQMKKEIEGYVVLSDNKVKIQESVMIEKYFDLTRELKKN